MNIFGSQSSKNKSSLQKTILLLGNYRPTLTLARTLAQQGYRIFSGLQGCDGGAQHSRFVERIWDHPDFKYEPQKFFDELADFVKTNGVSVVFPVSEDFVRLFAEHPQSCPDTIVAMVDPRIVEKCLDKTFMMNLACRHDVPTAPFAFAANREQLAQAIQTTGFPLVIRPQDSTKRLNNKKALFIVDEQDLKHQLPVWSAGQGGLILQKKALGKRHNIYFAANEGSLFRYLHAVILRTDNPDGSGLAVEGITIAPIPELRIHTTRLIKALNYTGIGCAQFLVDEETGDISFLEINARIAGNHAVPEHAGLNLSSQLIDQEIGNNLNTTYIEGKPGIRYVWTCGDIEAAKIAWIKSEASNTAAIAWAMRAILAAVRADLHMTFTWSDPKPGLMAFKSLLPNWSKLFSKIWRRNLRQSQAGFNSSNGKSTP